MNLASATRLRSSFARTEYLRHTWSRYRDMIGAAAGFILLGLVFLFVIPWVGIAAGAVGVALLVLFLLGFGRRAADGCVAEPQ